MFVAYRWNLQVIQHVDVRKWHPWGAPHLMAMFMGALMISIDKRLGIRGALFWDKARAKSNLGGPLESKMGGIGFRHVPSTRFLNCQTRLNLNIVWGHEMPWICSFTNAGLPRVLMTCFGFCPYHPFWCRLIEYQLWTWKTIYIYICVCTVYVYNYVYISI